MVIFYLNYYIYDNANQILKMSPIFKCLICRRDIERSTKTFWSKKGHLLCSSCLDSIDKNSLSKK